MRRSQITRKTSETQIELTLGLDGTGDRQIDTPIPFLNHMLDSFSRHGLFDLKVSARGDVEIDAHHTVEDIGIPMDETLVSAAVDFGGRATLIYRANALRGRWIGAFDAELAREFFGGFASTALCNLHLEVRYGENAHHMVEALFKAFARATSAAARRDPRVVGVPSTKGTLTG